MFNCPSCKKCVAVKSIKDIKIHLGHHKQYGELDFPIRCCEPYCQATCDYIYNYGRHFEKFHSFNTEGGDVVMSESEEIDDLGLHENEIIDNRPNNRPSLKDKMVATRMALQGAVTNIVIDLRGRGNVPFNVTIDVVEYFKDVFEIIVDNFSEALKTEFDSFDLENVKAKVMDISLEFKGLQSVFDGFAFEYRIRKLYENHPRFVSPEPIVIGHYHAIERVVVDGKLNHVIVEKPCIAQYVSIKKTFLSLIKDPLYLKCLLQCYQGQEGVYSCFRSGSRFTELSINDSGRIVSYIQIFYDGLGITNPLKAGASKHNSGMFYFTNLSLPPSHNATLANIHLLAMCHSNDIKNKNSLNQLLSKIVSELKDLNKNGIEIESSDGQKITLYVKLGQFTADNLGMNQICGLVESFLVIIFVYSAMRLVKKCIGIIKKINLFYVVQFSMSVTFQG